MDMSLKSLETYGKIWKHWEDDDEPVEGVSVKSFSFGFGRKIEAK